MKTMTFLAGAAVGYVLGTRAGQERYREIVEGVRDLGNRPAVQQAQSKVKDMLNWRSDATPSGVAGYQSPTGASTASEAGAVGAEHTYR